VSQVSIRVANYTQNICLVVSELLYDRRNADKVDHMLRPVIDQKRRVDVEDEEWRVTEVIPATVNSSRSPTH